MVEGLKWHKAQQNRRRANEIGKEPYQRIEKKRGVVITRNANGPASEEEHTRQQLKAFQSRELTRGSRKPSMPRMPWDE